MHKADLIEYDRVLGNRGDIVSVTKHQLDMVAAGRLVFVDAETNKPLHVEIHSRWQESDGTVTYGVRLSSVMLIRQW